MGNLCNRKSGELVGTELQISEFLTDCIILVECRNAKIADYKLFVAYLVNQLRTPCIFLY